MNAHVDPLLAGILNQHARIAVHFAAPDMQAEMQAMADAVKARRAAAQPQALPVQPQPVKSRAQLLAELQIEQQDFDPAYEFSDDHGVWSFQRAKESRINELRRQLAQVAA